MGLYLEVKIPAGYRIEDAIEEAKELSKKLDVGIEFRFNSTLLFVYWDDNTEEIVRQYRSIRRAGLHDKA